MNRRETDNLVNVENKAKLNLSQEEMEYKKKKSKRIKTGILLILMLPISIFILAMDWYPNRTICLVSIIISGLCYGVGLFEILFALIGLNEKSFTIIEDNEKDKKNIKKITFLEKLNLFKSLEHILIFLAIPAFLGLFLFIAEDPMNLLEIFPNSGILTVTIMIILVIILNWILIFIAKEKDNRETKKMTLTRKIMIMTFIGECVFTCYFIYYISHLS